MLTACYQRRTQGPHPPPSERSREATRLALACQADPGNSATREALIQAMMGHGVNVAKAQVRSHASWMGPGETWAFEYADLESAIAIGVLEAILDFDATLGEFTTFATWHVRKAVQRRGINLRWRVGNGQSIRVAKCRDGDDPRVVAAEACFREPLGNDRDPMALVTSEADDGPRKVAAVEAVEVAMSRLDDRDARVLRMRFGIGGGEPMTLAEVGRAMGLSRERVRQIQDVALAKARQRTNIGNIVAINQ